jgi:hypothetical protein
MIISFSSTLYQTSESYEASSNRWLELATSVDIPNGSLFFNSLLNTALGYDPVGWGYLSLSADTAKPLMESAVQCLIILLGVYLFYLLIYIYQSVIYNLCLIYDSISFMLSIYLSI